MADELEIDIELSNELIDEMTKQCNAVVNNITKINHNFGLGHIVIHKKKMV